MNLPNRLTVMRICLVPLMVAALLIPFPCRYLVAGLIFGAASLTDYFDGKIARQKGIVTSFGKFADPLADKILVLSALLCFVQNGVCDCLLVIVVLFREFAVTSVRLVAAAKGDVVAANIWGKAKTVSQIIAVIAVFAMQFFIELCNFGVFGFSAETITAVSFALFVTGEVLLWISAALAVVSGIIYICQSKEHLKDF